MIADAGSATVQAGQSVAATSEPLGLTMLGSMDAGSCADGLCEIPEPQSATPPP